MQAGQALARRAGHIWDIHSIWGGNKSHHKKCIATTPDKAGFLSSLQRDQQWTSDSCKKRPSSTGLKVICWLLTVKEWSSRAPPWKFPHYQFRDRGNLARISPRSWPVAHADSFRPGQLYKNHLGQCFLVKGAKELEIQFLCLLGHELYKTQCAICSSIQLGFQELFYQFSKVLITILLIELSDSEQL